MNVRSHASPAAFKQALEMRLRSASDSGVAFARRRQLLVFDRFLARIVAIFGDAVTLKGGLVLELRLDRARSTKDVDLRLDAPSDDVLARLQGAGRLDLGDFMAFEVGPDDDHPEILTDGAQYDGLRFRAECRLAGRVYGRPFGVDVAFGDPIFGDPEDFEGEGVLAFAGVRPPKLRLYPIESHIAEKLHAYTMPRLRPNSRVKDLPDMALLSTSRDLDGVALRTAIDQTFEHRATHAVPRAVPMPPESWAPIYAKMAKADGLEWQSLAAVTRAVQDFLDPVLAGGATRWCRSERVWRS